MLAQCTVRTLYNFVYSASVQVNTVTKNCYTMDDDILKTVHSIFGKSVQIVDCEKTSSVRQEEVLLINGIPVTLAGHNGDAIKSALLTGQVPSVELLNQLLYQAGILRQPVQLETSLSVKSSMVTTEEVSVTRDGQILDGHSSETKEDHVYNSSKKEIWKPVAAKPDMETIACTATLHPAVGTADAVIPSCSPMNGTAPVRGVTFTITDQVLTRDSGGFPDYYYNYKTNERVRKDDEDVDDEDVDEDDEYGELYVLNPQLTPSSPFANRLPPNRNATNIVTNDSADDITRKYGKAISKSFLSGKKSSVLSCDSGHDGVFNSLSQQTATTPMQNSTTNNTMHSTSSCYDFISSDEVDFLTANTNSSSSKGRSYEDLHNRQPSQISKSPNNKNVKSPNLGKKPSMSSSSCVSAANPSSSSTHQSSLQHAPAGNINASDVAAAVPLSKTTTTSAISVTSVENGLVFRDGNLISGLLGSLIAHMVPSSQYYPDRSFIFSFLLSARLFIRPHELLARISEIWESQQRLQYHTIAPSHDVVDDSAVLAANISYLGRSQQMYPPQFADEQSRQKALKSAKNCIRLLAEWIDTFPYDFRDERLMQHVRVLARKCVYIDNSLGKTVSNILQSLVQRLTVLEKYEEFLQTLAAQENNDTCPTTEGLATHFKMFSSDASPECHTNLNAAGSTSSNEREDAALAVEPSNAVGTVGMPHRSLSSSHTNAPGLLHQHQSIHLQSHQNSHHQSDSSSNSVNTLGPSGSGGGIGIGSCTSSGGVTNGAEIIGICDLCPNAALLAHQLTHIELERLSHIGPEEFVQAFAKENHLESFSDMKKTRNLESYVQWFNRLSYFTATEIVKYPKKKQRVRVIEFWIETARECFNIGNFNSLMAIIAGLNLSPISRLKKTWSKVQLAKFSVLEHQMDPTSNFNSYRSTLKAAMWRSEGATNERERIIIPFFSLLVKDLYFLNEGCSNRLPNGHINFEKFWQLAKQVMEFNTWKKVTCPFEKLPKVIMFLQMSSVLNENTLSMASFECEPPENHQERGRYKTLKSETRHQT